MCGCERGSARLELAFAEIWRRLETDWGASFTPDVLQRHTPSPTTRLIECESCGLQHFVPAVPGDGEFYEELTRATSYVADRWEFGVVASRLRPGEAIVDLRCGDGAFLRRLDDHEGRVVGVDHNSDATRRLAAAGIEAFDCDPAEFARHEPRSFDVACGFQILEHVADAGDLIRAIRELLRPGGRIFLSLPNRERAVMDERAPFDCPPHHISRWSSEQIAALAERFGLLLDDIAFEPIDYSGAVAAKLGRAESRFGELPRRVRSLALTVIRHTVMRPTRFDELTRRGVLAARRVRGHTMLAELRAR